MTVLLTRPYWQAQQTSEKLQAVGIQSHIDPLLVITALPMTLDLHKSYQAILMTSRNALPGLAQINSDIPVFTVGDSTAQAVKSTYPERKVVSAGGNGQELAQLVEAQLSAKKGPLLYLSADEVHYDIAQHLRERGFSTDRKICYSSQQAVSFLPETLKLLTHQQIHYILFYSRRTAQTFATIIKQDNLEQLLSTVVAITMSVNVHDSLQALSFSTIKTAVLPTEEFLLKELYDETQRA